jgi:hypothetical protein
LLEQLSRNVNRVDIDATGILMGEQRRMEKALS